MCFQHQAGHEPKKRLNGPNDEHSNPELDHTLGSRMINLIQHKSHSWVVYTDNIDKLHSSSNDRKIQALNGLAVRASRGLAMFTVCPIFLT